MLTTRAATVLANAPLVFIDPDVPEPVLALIGKDLPPVSGPTPAGPAPGSADGAAGPVEGDHSQAMPAVMPGGPDLRPALGDPAEVAKTLIAEARSGVDRGLVKFEELAQCLGVAVAAGGTGELLDPCLLYTSRCV